MARARRDPARPRPRDLVTLHVAESLPDALLFQGRLQSLGIAALVPGSHDLGYGLLMLPDTRVQVQSEDRERAQLVLDDWLHPTRGGAGDLPPPPTRRE